MKLCEPIYEIELMIQGHFRGQMSCELGNNLGETHEVAQAAHQWSDPCLMGV